MGLADDLRRPVTTASPQRMNRSAPKGFEPGVKYDAEQIPESGTVVLGIGDEEKGWRNRIEAALNVTIPEDREVVLTETRLWGDPEKPLVYAKFHIVTRSTPTGTGANTEHLLKVARANMRRKPPKASTLTATRTRLVGMSDEQWTKVDRNGGTEETHARVGQCLGELDIEIAARPCQDAVMLFGGDLLLR